MVTKPITATMAMVLSVLWLSPIQAQPAQPAPATSPPGASTQPPPGVTNLTTELQRRTNELMQLATTRSKTFNEQLEKTLREVGSHREAIEKAEQIVDEVIATIRKAIEEGRPDGPLAQHISALERLANEEVIRAENDNEQGYANEFRRMATSFANLRTALGTAYSDGFRTLREIEARKRNIIRSRQLNDFEGAQRALDSLVAEYRQTVDAAQAFADAASAAASAAGRPRQ